ncbi:MAG: hypothetical protein V3U92_09200 [Cellulophaga sp.]
MKKTVLVIALLVGLTTMAQKEKQHKQRVMKDLTAEQIATLRTKKMTLALDLTETQQKQVQKLNIENATFHKKRMEERSASRESGERKRLSSEERYAMQNAQLDRRIAQQQKVKQILNEEQYSQWKKMQHKKGKQPRKKHRTMKNKTRKTRNR